MYLSINRGGEARSDTVRLGVDSHWHLFGELDEEKWPLLTRLKDYYSDSEFAPEELDDFLEELDRRFEGSSSEDSQVLEKLMELVRMAKQLGLEIVAEAD